MGARGCISCLLLLTCGQIVRSQDSLWVDVTDQSNQTLDEDADIEKRYTPELTEELMSAKADALLLFTEYTAIAGEELKSFLMNVTAYSDDAIRNADNVITSDYNSNCRSKFDSRIRTIQNDARRAASFSGENHHKFLLGHMIVMRMHLNKSESLVKKCTKAVRDCGISCETIPRVKRWRRQALEEIHRVREDMQHSRRSYKDLVLHARRKLNHLHKQVIKRSNDAVDKYHECLRR
ncbi:uncharacterized protein LOC101741292 [Bombyx mori]|uniref:Uncharacterized protein n=1 Tax=Bombyx mori TaxID=7091 RepID=A0A8R1WG88_BOMMO|nr:uncharacterized protein LOC101741292 [Bombyx mori]